MAGGYQAFLNALGKRESGGNYHAVNSLGYLGKYQMGEGALIDTGYYTPDGTSANDWQSSHWTGKGGIDSKAEFLNSPQAQEAAIRAYMAKQFQYIQSVWQYADQVIHGVKITISGMLAGAHLVGNGGLKTYLNSGGDNAPVDGNGVSVASYVKQFAGYTTPFKVNHGLDETLNGGSGNDKLYGRGGSDTLSGKGGDDSLYGGAGRDVLSGGAGGDQFVFRKLNDRGDTITDFGTGGRDGATDHLVIATHAFGGHAGDSVHLVGLDKPLPKHAETIIYDKASGKVFYDPDGAGPKHEVLIAVLANHAILHAADVWLI